MTQPGLLRQYQSKLSFVQRLVDAVVICSVLYLFVAIRGIPWTNEYTILALIAVAVFLFTAESRELYRSWRGVSVNLEISRFSIAWLITTLAVLFLGFATKSNETYSRFVVISWLVTVPIILATFRIVFRRTLNTLRVLGRNTRSVAIVGAGKMGIALANSILDHPWMGLNLQGFFSDDQPTGYQPSRKREVKVIGNINDLINQAKNIDIVYIALPMREESKIIELVQNLGDSMTTLYLVPDLFTFDLLHSRWTELSGIQVVSIYESPFNGVAGWLKKLEDIVLSIFILIAIFIPALFLAVAIKVSSRGPILFKQRRYGLNGQEITVWKFRTMTVAEDGDHIKQATKGDSRITPIGRLLRATSLDELPQFINVLQGRMSIVGPRPHAVAHNEEYRKLVPLYMLRHKVKPGITGWAQVNGWRGETDTVEKMEKRVEYDLEYIRNWSLWLDLKIIMRTIFSGFRHKNAY